MRARIVALRSALFTVSFAWAYALTTVYHCIAHALGLPCPW